MIYAFWENNPYEKKLIKNLKENLKKDFLLVKELLNMKEKK